MKARKPSTPVKNPKRNEASDTALIEAAIKDNVQKYRAENHEYSKEMEQEKLPYFVPTRERPNTPCPMMETYDDDDDGPSDNSDEIGSELSDSIPDDACD